MLFKCCENTCGLKSFVKIHVVMFKHWKLLFELYYQTSHTFSNEKKKQERERENLYSNNSIYYYYYYYIIGLFKIFYYMIGYSVLILKFELIGENEDQSANPSGDTSLSVLLRRKFEVRRAEKD